MLAVGESSKCHARRKCDRKNLILISEWLKNNFVSHSVGYCRNLYINTQMPSMKIKIIFDMNIVSVPG